MEDCTSCLVIGASDSDAGSGKSALVHELAMRTGNQGYMTVHVDDQMDSKTLLGSYIASSIPGEFSWQPGLLTQVSPHILLLHGLFQL